MCRAVGSSDQSNSYRSPTAWLADVAREGFGQCKGTLRLAERIVHMPRVQASFGNGAIPEAALRLLTDSWAAVTYRHPAVMRTAPRTGSMAACTRPTQFTSARSLARDSLENGEEGVAWHNVGAVGSNITHDFGIVGDHNDRTIFRQSLHLVADHVVGNHTLGRVDNSNEPPTVGVGPDDRCAIEYDGHIGAKPTGQVLKRVE